MVDDIQFFKYPRIPHLSATQSILDKPVEVYEKMDGGNSQIRKVNSRVICGSRSKFLGPKGSMKEPWFRDFQKWALSNHSFYNLPENVVVYGEWLSPHTIEYAPSATNNFFLLDILNIDTKRFMPYKEGQDFLAEHSISGINYLTTLLEGKVTMAQLGELIKHSHYRAGKMEGVVVKDYNSSPQRFAKLWASMVDNNRKGLNYDDVKKVALSLLDDGVKVTRDLLIQEVIKEAESGAFSFPVSKSEVKNVVKTYLENTIK